MLKIGQLNQLRISRISQFGCYLDGGEQGEVLLVNDAKPDNLSVEESLEVFVYVDTDETILATLRQPRLFAGQCAALRVVSATDNGVYLDWGMKAELFVPRSELLESAPIGQWVVAVALIDADNQRMIASTRLYKYLSSFNEGVFESGQSVQLLVCQQTELGYKAVVNGSHLGVLYHSEIFQTLAIGQSLTGFVKRELRDDDRIDLELRQIGQHSRDNLESQILTHLKNHGGVSGLTDKSPPKEIYQVFAVSKKAYKNALGGLYRKKMITLDKQKIALRTVDNVGEVNAQSADSGKKRVRKKTAVTKTAVKKTVATAKPKRVVNPRSQQGKK